MGGRDTYQLIVIRNRDVILYQDGHGVLRTTNEATQEEADAEALGMMAKRLKFSARRMRKDARKKDDDSNSHGRF